MYHIVELMCNRGTWHRGSSDSREFETARHNSGNLAAITHCNKRLDSSLLQGHPLILVLFYDSDVNLTTEGSSGQAAAVSTLKNLV